MGKTLSFGDKTKKQQILSFFVNKTKKKLILSTFVNKAK